MRINSLNFNTTNCCGNKSQTPAFKANKTSVISDVSNTINAFLLEQRLLKERYTPKIKNPTIAAKFEPKQKGKIFGDFIVFNK